MFYYDPVCKRKINRQKAHSVVIHDGERYYLCCPVCQRLFEKEPEQYLKDTSKRHKSIFQGPNKA